MPRDRKGIGRTGNKQKRSKAKVSSQTSPQAVEAEAGALAEAEAPAEAAEQPSSAVLDRGHQLQRAEAGEVRSTPAAPHRYSPRPAGQWAVDMDWALELPARLSWVGSTPGRHPAGGRS